MNVFFVGDVMGKPGRYALKDQFQKLIEEFNIHFTVVNVENAAGGFGITPKIADELISLGANVLTSGNHIWERREIYKYMEEETRLLRPANYPPEAPGKGVYLGKAVDGTSIAVVNILGKTFMRSFECPFRAAERILQELNKRANIIIIDFHAEATSEKIAMGWFLDGRVSAVVGTHTHVQTADERVLPQGTAYITDVGMTGPHDSVIGIKKEIAIERFLTYLPNRFEVGKGDIRISAVVIDIDSEKGIARGIKRIHYPVTSAANIE
jgi:metallophosphoesterase (TIGR00282 family)